MHPRGGMALRHGITLQQIPGTVEADYRGEVKVLRAKLGREPFTARRGDRLARLVFAQVERARPVEAAVLEETSRGEGGCAHRAAKVDRQLAKSHGKLQDSRRRGRSDPRR